MSESVEFKETTISDSKKRIMLPFLACHNVEYICSVEDQLASMAKKESLSKERVAVIKNKLDYTAHYLKIATAYMDFVNQEFNSKFSISDALTQPQVHKPRPLGRIDAASAVIDTEQMQSLDFMQELCKNNKTIDFKKNLITVANDKIAAHNGLSRVHNADISAFFDLPYRLWEHVHIECLVIVMIQAARVTSIHRERGDWLTYSHHFRQAQVGDSKSVSC
ncbi:MAG: hypothetical protein J6N72_02885 [Psychrobacter sp.]|nr:hypothetical protein [Psychrobacter sp.]